MTTSIHIHGKYIEIHGSIRNAYLFAISHDYTEPRLLLRGNAWECVACIVIKICRTTDFNCMEMRVAVASSCIEMRRTAARNCMEMRGNAAWVGMRVAWTPPKRGSSARDASGKRVESAAQVWLKRVGPRFHALVDLVFIWDRHVKNIHKVWVWGHW